MFVFVIVQDNISQLKAKMASNSKECDERNRIIKEVHFVYFLLTKSVQNNLFTFENNFMETCDHTLGKP